jgi:hypothetical protein
MLEAAIAFAITLVGFVSLSFAVSAALVHRSKQRPVQAAVEPPPALPCTVTVPGRRFGDPPFTTPALVYDIREDGMTLTVAGQQIELHRDGTLKTAPTTVDWRTVNDQPPAAGRRQGAGRIIAAVEHSAACLECGRTGKFCDDGKRLLDGEG